MYVQDKWAFVEVYKNNAVLIGLNDLWNFIKTWFNCGKYNDIMRFPAEGYYYEAEQYFINVPIIDGELDLPDNNSIFLIAFNLPREGLKVVCTFTDYS